MKTTVKTSTNSNSQTTSNPPHWTQGYLANAADAANNAYQEVSRVPAYEGDFFARPDLGLVDQIGNAYQGVANSSAQGAQRLDNLAREFLFPLMAPSDGNPNPSAQFGMQLPEFAPAAQFNAPAIMDMPDFSALVPQFYQRPEMAALPTWQGFTPDAWMADDGGARLNTALEGAIAPVTRELTNNILPSIKSSALEAGAWTGDRAMGVLPTNAIAEASRRMSEITGQLVYQGFQEEEARRLAAWQTTQEIGNQQSLGENQFNLGLFDSQNDFNLAAGNQGLNLLGQLINAGVSTYGTRQNALLDAANMANDYNFNNRSLDINSALDLFRADTDRTLGVADSRRQDAQIGNAIQQQSLNNQAAQADILQQLLQLRMGVDQNTIDNALARENYNIMQPYQGLDVLTALLTQLSGNWGTQSSKGSSTSTQTTSGAGPIMQGVLGAGLAGASIFGGGGPLSSLIKPAASAGGGISTIFSPGGIWGK